jgi:hypothetical protein
MGQIVSYTGPTSNTDNQMRIQTSQRSAAYDPVDKLRVSQPQSLIDTDFEYGQQPSKWEQLDLENNRQSCWYNQNAPLAVTAVTGNGTTTVVVSTTATVAIGTPVFLEDCLDSNANGWWYVTASTGGTSFTIVTTNVVATGNQYNATATYVYAGYFYTNAGFAVAAASTTAIVTSGTAITVNTAFPHGLSAGSYVFIVGTTGGTGVNGAWVVATVPTSTQFTIATTGASGTVTTSGSSGNVQTNVYARPSGYVETRAYDGSVNFTAGAAVPNQQMMRQTRRYFRYQSGKGIQFSTGSILKPRLFVTSVTNNGSNTTVTVTTRWPHNMTVNSFIQVTTASIATYNGIFKIASVPTPNTLTYVTASGVIPASSPALTTTGLPVSVSPYSWYGSSNKIGFFDSQNGLFFQFDGQTLYAVWRNSINQLSGTVSVTQGSATVTGTGTVFTNQLNPGDYIVIRGQSYRVLNIASDTSLFIGPEYRGSTIANALVSKTIDTKVPQSQWFDPLDGTGSSGYTLDLTKNQMWFIDYSWYGAGVARFGLRTTGGAIAYMYAFQSNNIQYQAYMRSGNLPSRYESNGQAAITNLYASITSSVTTIPVVSAAGFNPAGGTLKITAAASGGAIEYITYSGITTAAQSGLAYDQFTGCTRAATGGGVASAFTAAYPATNATPPISVEYAPPDSVAVISHWGSSVVMDGGFSQDVSLIYNYGTTTAVSVPASATVPILAIRVAPSVDNGQTGILGNKEVINRLQLQLRELGVVTSGTFLIQLNLNGYTNGGSPSWTSFASPTQNNTVTSSIVQVSSQTSTTATFTGGESIAAAFTNSSGQTTLDLTSVAGIGNAILGGGLTNTVPTSYAGQYPDGPDILYVVATNTAATASTILARLSWQESQA